MYRMVDAYDMIFKRKSFHLFRNVGSDKASEEELRAIEEAWQGFEKLCPEIRTGIRIVPADRVNLKKDAEYCLLLYSEKKENYLMNMGYIGEQMDLYLVEHHFGSLWYGIGKPDESDCDGMEFVIMLAIRKVNDDTKYRKDMYKAKRKPLAEVWSGDDMGIADIARFAPSACNTQPWFVKNEGGTLTVFRYKKPGKRGIMPAASVSYYNRIDIGIYLCILEICMEKNGIGFTRELFADNGEDREMTKVAVYRTA